MNRYPVLMLAAVLYGIVPGHAAFAKEPIIMHAHGSFEVKIEPQQADNPPAQAAGLARLSLDKRFHGALEAVSQGEMLASSDSSQKNGAYVALEKVVGSLNGHKGSFVLVHRSLLRDGEPEGWTVNVVPGSGTDDLAGIEGEMRITIKDGQHFYDLDYTLPDLTKPANAAAL